MGKKREFKLPAPGLCYKGRQHNQIMGYRRVSETPSERDKITHGRQSKISGEDAHKKVGWDTTPKPCVKCFTTQTVKGENQNERI
jgi:hypothetical protein